MKRFLRNSILLLVIGLLSACSPSPATPIPVMPTDTPTPLMPTAAPAASATKSWSIFSETETKTLDSLKQIDGYPLFAMRYYQEEYASGQPFSLPVAQESDLYPGWGCSLFTVLLDEDHLLYGRNFDWTFSPALLLYTDPPDGYASVSMVAIEFLEFSTQSADKLLDLPLEKRAGLLRAPRFPFDGMNEHGLVVAMAAVPQADTLDDPSKDRMTSLVIIREILDHARDVDEAVDLIGNYNIFWGGLPLHYLIADATGRAVLVEFYQGEMRVLENEQPWYSATNFVLSSVEDPGGNCWRYDRIDNRLNEEQGLLDTESAMELLADVSQKSSETPTQWSVVYQMGHREMSIAMGMDYENVLTFRFSDFQSPDFWDSR
jgi:hypothetical protein